MEASFQQQLREMEAKNEAKSEQLEALLRKQSAPYLLTYTNTYCPLNVHASVYIFSERGSDASTDLERDLLQQQRSEIAMLKEQLQQQVCIHVTSFCILTHVL